MNYQLKIFLLSIVLCFAACFASVADAFEEGNKLYMTQQYEKAIEAYMQHIKSGKATAEAYFNAGNCYYKLGNFASAILNYERALKLNASDEDIKFNLALANQNTVDKIEPAPKVFYERWWDNFLQSSTPDRRAATGIVLIWITAALACIYIFTNRISLKKLSFYTGAIALLAAVFFIFLAGKQEALAVENRGAIVFKTSAYVKSSPEEKSTNLFMLHAGTKIEVIDELIGWKKIRIPNGNIGWMKDNELEVI